MPPLAYSKGNAAADNSATWGAMFKQQVERCWKKPYGGIEAQKSEAVFAIRLKRDGTALEGMPVPEGSPGTPYSARLSGERVARDHRMPAVPAACRVFRGMEIFRACFHRTENLRARAPAITNR